MNKKRQFHYWDKCAA